MSGKKKKRLKTPPPSSAGLFRFFEESSGSIIKIRPEIIVIATAVFIVLVVLAGVFVPT